MLQSKRLRYSVLAAMCAAFLLSSPVPASAQPGPNALTIPIVGTVLGGGSFAGNLTLQQFRVVDGVVMAVGTLTGTLTTAAGQVVSVVRNVLLPVAITQATCGILHLDLGPLDLNLLGLQVNLSQVVLDITAESGAGNLLGNLLCTVAGLLDSGGPLSAVTTALNRILDILI